MKSMPFLLLALPLALSAGLFAAGGERPAQAAQKANASTSYLITNDDSPGKGGATGGTFFPIGSDGTLVSSSRVSLGGPGVGGGYFGATRVSILQSSTEPCVYLSIAGAAQIGAVDINSLQDIGNFSAAPTDSARDNGIGLVNNGTYLYASFTYSDTIATFALLPGCGLSF